MTFPSSKTFYCNGGDGSSTGYYAIPVWPGTSHAVAAGAVCRQLTTPSVGNERVFVCIIAGTTSASAEPTWVVTQGAKTTDGTVTWIEVTGHAPLNGDTVNATPWLTVKNFSVSSGVVIYDSVSGSVQVCTTAGTTSNGTQPTFSATAGVITSDGATVKWTSLGLASNFAAWANPWARMNLALASGNFMIGGETVYVSNHHTETQASGMSYNFLSAGVAGVGPVKILCVDDSVTPPINLATGASASTTGANGVAILASSNGAFYIYGISFTAGSGAVTAAISIGSAAGNSNGLGLFDNCTFKLGGTVGGNYNFNSSSCYNCGICYNCTFLFSSAAQNCLSGNGGGELLQVIGGAFASSGTVPTAIFALINTKTAYFRDVDFSAVSTTLIAANTASCNLLLENCKLSATGVIVATGGGNAWQPNIRLHNCDSAGTTYRYYYYTGSCIVQQETIIVRQNSLATDGTTPISWNCTTSTLANYALPFFSDPIAIYNPTIGNKTLTVYLTTNTTLTNKDIWFEAEYFGSSSSPLGFLTSTKGSILLAPTALTSDTSTWGGSITNKYSIALTVNTQLAGPIKIRLYLAKPSITVYVDPYIYIT